MTGDTEAGWARHYGIEEGKRQMIGMRSHQEYEDIQNKIEAFTLEWEETHKLPEGMVWSVRLGQNAEGDWEPVSADPVMASGFPFRQRDHELISESVALKKKIASAQRTLMAALEANRIGATGVTAVNIEHAIAILRYGDQLDGFVPTLKMENQEPSHRPDFPDP